MVKFRLNYRKIKIWLRSLLPRNSRLFSGSDLLSKSRLGEMFSRLQNTFRRPGRILNSVAPKFENWRIWDLRIALLLIPLLALAVFFTLSLVGSPRVPKLKNGTGDSLYIASNNIYRSTIGTKSGEPKVSFNVGSSTAGFTLAGGTKATPHKKSNTAIFPEVMAGIDLHYTTTANGIKEELIINQYNKNTPTTFLFDLSLTGVSPKRLTTNFIDPSFKDQQGNYQFHFEKPFAVDARGVRTDNVILQIMEDKQLPGQYSLKLIVDESWLADPTRAYPVSIDPTIVHDTTVEFATGYFDRVKDTGGSIPALATGGTITYAGGYTIHTFTTSGTFTPSQSMNVETLVVAGGGGGGYSIGGGGGAGGLIYNSSFAVTAGAITVTVGTGGAGATSNAAPGVNGNNSVFSTLTAVGGGGGGSNAGGVPGAGVNGGSGGGAGENSGGATKGLGTSGQGNDGGLANDSPANYGSGGGGGAGAVGANGTATTGGNGGVGLAYSISGSSTYYAGGGGGGTYQGGTAGIGGNGGGGNAGAAGGNNPGANGTANTGGGGGGASYQSANANGGAGGSGIVIIRYLSSQSSNLETYYQELSTDQYTVGLWHLNEASGSTTSDFSGNGRTGTLNATPTWATSANSLLGNSSLTFSSSSKQNVSMTNFLGAATTGVTFEAWVKYNTLPASGYTPGIVMAGGGSSPYVSHVLGLENNAGTYRWRWLRVRHGTSTSYDLTFNYTPTVGVWYHLAGTNDGSRANLYLNGNLVASTTSDVGVGSSGTNTDSSLRFGREYYTGDDATSRYIDATIDEVRISNIARTPEEIRASASRRPYAVYTSDVLDLSSTVSSWNPLTWTELGVGTGDGETLKSSTNLLAQWNFNETSGTTADNAEGTAALDGTLTNFASTASQDQAAGTGWTSANRRWGAGALMFDGTDDHVIVTNTAALNPTTAITIESWFQMKALPVSGGLYEIAGKASSAAGHAEYDLAIINNSGVMQVYWRMHLGAGLTTYVYQPNYPFIPGNWYHLTATYDTASMKMITYVNGQKIGTDMTTLGESIYSGNLQNLFIGVFDYNGTKSRYLNGTIDSTRIYSRALGAAEIMSNYQSSNIEFQTRVGSDITPNDGSWEAWKSITGETSIDSMDSSVDEWSIDNNRDSPSTINKSGVVNIGNGNDGACIMDNGTKTLDSTAGSSVCNSSARSTAYAVNFSVTGNTVAGSTSITVSSTPTGLVAGDEFIIINLQGTSTNYQNVGKYETHIISSISTNTLNFTDYPLKLSYDGTTQKIMVQRVPNFGAVTICGGNTGSGCTAAATLTVSAWNGTKNGVLFFRSTGTVTVNSGGTITGTGTGYRGGSGVLSTAGYQGESYNGTGSQTNASNGGGGGAGNCYNLGSNWGTAGAGGSFGTTGSNTRGDNNCAAWVGYAGNINGLNNSESLSFGSGGGAGIGSASYYGAGGGAGGGIVIIFSNSTSISGSITSNGANGSNGTDTTRGNGGGGSGGLVYLNSNSITAGSSLITVAGGAGGTATNMWGGGAGGYGRIIFKYTSSFSGTTTPSAHVSKLQSTIKSEGSGAIQLQTGRPEVDSNTVGLWHLDETSGTSAYIKDSSSNANHLTPTGTTSVNGINSKGRDLDGTSDVLAKTSPTGLPTGASARTIELWVKPDNVNPGGTLVHYGDEGGAGQDYIIELFNSAGTQYLFTDGVNAGNNISITGAEIPPVGKWSHIAFTLNGSNGWIYYLNGTNTKSGTFGTAINTATPTKLNIGDRTDTAIANYPGLIDEVRISNVARTAEEVAESYRMGRDHYINKTISSTDLSGKSSLPFYVAADRPGSYLSATIGESAFANYQPDSSTVGLWHLNEQSGSGAYIKDASGNANHGTPTGTTFTQGKVGKGRSFNGSSDYINTGNTINLSGSSFTISSWAKRSTTGTYDEIIGQGTTSNNSSLNFGFRSSNVFFCAFYANDLDTTATYTDSNWHYWTCSYDTTSNSRKIYMDGVLITSDTAVSDYTGSGQLNIGAGYSTPSDYFSGLIDEVSISNTARTATEIRQAYEIGQRTHQVTIDFGAKLDSGNLIADVNDLGFTVDATYYGLNQKGDAIYPGDKIIVKENVDETEYIAQGTLTAVTASTGAVTVTSWDSGSTFPSVGYTVNAAVFKWQREYWNINNEVLDTFTDSITNLTLRLTDGSEGRTIWLDDLRSNSAYLTTSTGSTIDSSTGNQYMQYRAILSSFDEAVSATLSAVTLDYTVNSSPSTPSLDSPTDTAINQSLTPVLSTTTTDPDSDYLRYKIELCTDVGMSTGCQTFDQTSSQTGWSGQNAQTSTAYTSGTQGSYTLQSAILPSTTYYWRSYAIDPAGTDTWSSTQGTPYSFTTTAIPTAPTDPYAEGATNPTGIVDTTPEFSAIHNDSYGDSANAYEIEVNTNNTFTGTVMWDSGAVSMSELPNEVRSADISYAGTALPLDGAGTTYYWRIRFTDTLGATGTWSATQSFAFNYAPSAPATPYTEGSTNPTGVIDTTPEFSAIHSDPEGEVANYYEIEVNTNNSFSGTVMWDSGAVSMTSLASGVRSTDVSYAGTAIPLDGAGTTYYWRIRFTDSNGLVSAWSTTSSFTLNVAPTTPSLDSPISGITKLSLTPTLSTTSTDTNSDYLRYKIELCTNVGMSTGCQTFDQTSSQTGWSGQDTETSTAYSSGSQGIYTLTTNLVPSTTYYWRSYAIDPGGSNVWSSTQGAPYSFVTRALSEGFHCVINETSSDTSLTITWTDREPNEDSYKLEKNTDGGGFVAYQTLATNSTSYTDSSISVGHTYQYRISPYNTAGSVYGDWCTTNTLNLQLTNFGFSGLNFSGLNLN